MKFEEKGRQVKCVRAINQSESGTNGGGAKVLSGNIGEDNITIKMRSTLSHGLFFHVSIYANKVDA